MRNTHRIGRVGLAFAILASTLAAPSVARAEEVVPEAPPPAETTLLLDMTPPTLTVTTPQDGAVYRVGTRITIDLVCSDPESVITRCDGAYNQPGETVLLDTVGERHWIYVAHNSAGLVTSRDVRFRVIPDDSEPPAIGWQVRATDPSAWQTRPTEVLFWVDAEPGGSGIARLTVTDTRTGQLTETTGGALTVTAATDGVTVFSAVATDVAGNSSAPTLVPVRVDDGVPYIDVLDPSAGLVFERGSDATVRYACHDDGSGIDLCYIEGGDALDTSVLGTFATRIWARDNVGRVVFLDVDYTVVPRSDTPPSVELIAPPLPESGIYVGPVPLQLVARDDDGINAIHWRIDGGEWQAVEADSIDLIAPCGKTTIVDYWAIDDGGMRTETVTAEVTSICAPGPELPGPEIPPAGDDQADGAPEATDPPTLAVTGSAALPIALLAVLLLLLGAASAVATRRRA